MTAASQDRDGHAVDALVADRYLEDLLAAGDRRAADVPADAALDPALRRTVLALRAALVRVHPSFRFEERLAGRLAELAAVQAPRALASGDGALLPFGKPPPALAAFDPELAAVLDGRLDPAWAGAANTATAGGAAHGRATGAFGSVRRPVLVGGAVASAALSVVGVVLVAWRAARPGPGPMVRAVRIAHGRRLAAAADLSTAAADLASAGIGAGRPA